MARFLGKLIMILLLVLPTTIMLAGHDGRPSLVVRAQVEDDLDGEEDLVEGEGDLDATVETEGEEEGGAGDGMLTDSDRDETEEEEEEEEKALKPSEDADTYLLFTRPTNMEFPAGHMVRLLVGFTNKGDKDFIVETMEASFRYPQDYSFYIQNFTTEQFNKVVEPERQATFEYAFTPSETFNARPFGLTVNINYKDSEGNLFQDAVFNETINVTEPDEGLDGETFFLYVFLAAVAVLLLVGAQQFVSSFSKKKRGVKPRPAVEMGTQSKDDVDYDWLPKETLQDYNRSPKSKSPKQSPRQRRIARRATGSAED